ncbi:MAG: glycosyltransferase family 1 protein [Acidobacteriota bacterium]
MPDDFMHVVLDFRPALRQATGVGTYVQNLTTALCAAYPDDSYTVFSASWKDRVDAARVPTEAAIADWRIPVRVLDRAWNRWQWPPVEQLVGAVDIAHSPSPMLLPARHARTIVSVHDCYFIRHPEDVFGTVLRDYVPLARRAAQAADAVIVLSESGAREAQEVLGVSPDKLWVTNLGVERVFFRADAAAARSLLHQHGVDRPFLLFVGRREKRKDLGTLLAAFDELLAAGDDLQLVLVGPDAPGWLETWNVVPARARAAVRLLTHQPVETLAGLYAAATVVVAPSRWEGFGLTPLEAMAAGTPVVASAVGAQPEILADAALFAAAGDAAQMAHQCRRLLQDRELATRMSAAGREHAERFPWSATAHRTHKLYVQLAAS